MPIQPHMIEVMAPTTKATVVCRSVKTNKMPENTTMYTAMYTYSANRKDFAPSLIVLESFIINSTIVFSVPNSASFNGLDSESVSGFPSIFTDWTRTYSKPDQITPNAAGTNIKRLTTPSPSMVLVLDSSPARHPVKN